jgi:hypothetical protein
VMMRNHEASAGLEPEVHLLQGLETVGP